MEPESAPLRGTRVRSRRLPGLPPFSILHSPLSILACLALLVPAPALALQWYQHYERGLAAAERGDWTEALEELEAAADLQPEARTRVRTYGTQFLFGYDPEFHRARCLLELGRIDEAVESLEVAERSAVTDGAELAALRVRIESVPSAPAPGEVEPVAPEQGPDESEDREPEEGRDGATILRVDSRPPGAVGAVDGRPVGSTPFQIEVVPGRHRVRLLAPDRRLWERTVEVRSGEPLHLDVALVPLREGEAEPESSAEIEPQRLPVAETPPPTGAEALEEEAPATADGVAGDGVEPEVETGRPPSRVDTEGAQPTETGRTSPKPVLVAAIGLAIATSLLVAYRWWRRRSPSGIHPGAGRPRWRLSAGRHLVGPYAIDEEIGRGGMATTYRATRRPDGLAVALKIPHDSGDPTYTARFLREGALGEALHHPGIVTVHEVGEDGGLLYLAMELVEGQTVRELLDDRGKPLAVSEALELVRDVARALDYAHGKGVVHRDLKPENVMITADRRVLVMDFGVARLADQPGLTTSRVFLGSPIYAAPEIVEGGTADRRSDLYALGILLYELLEGEPPFVHESIFRLLELHRDAPLPAPESLPHPLPEAVWRIISRLCAKRPEERYPTAEALLVDLQRLLYRPAGETSWRLDRSGEDGRT